VNNSRAFTLVEMMVSISVGSVLLGLALGMIHRTMRFESTTRTYALNAPRLVCRGSFGTTFTEPSRSLVATVRLACLICNWYSPANLPSSTKSKRVAYFANSSKKTR